MNFKQLEALQAIMATGSTIGAASRMGLSQSAVSRLLGQLEEALGLTLFARKKGRLLAIPDAAELLAEISKVVDNVQRVQRLADEIRIGGARKTLVKVGVPTSMAQQMMPRVVAGFLEQYEDTVVEIVSGSYGAIERALLDRSADIGFVSLPCELADFDLDYTVNTEAVCVMPSDHPLSKQPVVCIDDLRETPLILLGRQRALRTDLDLAFRAANLTPQVRVEVHSAAAACGFVAQGLGVSIINSLLASHFDQLPIVSRPFKPLIGYTFGVAFRADEPRSRAVDDFAKHFIAYLSEHAAARR
jgi:DNA-binding transcriptional LysR family regulator